MKAERMIEILNEVTGNPNTVKYKDDVTCSEALTAMQRAVEEETARLKQCEAIVRELAGSKWITDQTIIDSRIKARQWVKDNPE